MRSVLILPLFNEEGNISQLIREVLKVRKKMPFDILLINDNSKDNTGKIIDGLAKEHSFITAIHHPENRGWGGGLKTGFGLAANRGYDVVICMDGDFTHNPSDIPNLIEAIEKGADVAVGSRFVRGGEMVGIPWNRVLLSEISNPVFRLLLGINVKDFTSGFRAHKVSFMKKIDIECDSFYVNLELLIKSAKLGGKIVEVPIKIYPRREGISSRGNILAEIPRYMLFILNSKRGVYK